MGQYGVSVPELEVLVSDLRSLVEVESPSLDLAALDASAANLAALIEERTGRAAQIVEGPAGPHVHWSGGGEPKVMILGHHDTVFPMGALAERPFTVADGRITGPGVFDMKAGIIQAIHAVAALDDARGVEMLFTADEWPGGKNLMTTPAIWRRAFEDIASDSFGLNFDPSHFALQFMEPDSALMEFRHKLFHMHAKDVRIYRDRLNQVGAFAHPLEWHQPRLPGYGEIDWPRYMGSVMETGYDGPMCIEVEDATFGSSLDGRKRAVRVARNVLAPFIP